MKRGFTQHRYGVLHWSLAAVCIILGLMGGSLPVLGMAEIKSDTRWTAAGSPYVLQSDLVIKAGAALTIEPGVEVRLAKINVAEGSSNRAEIIVQGQLLALGTVDQPIRFTADSDLEEMGDWAGIFLQGSGSRLEYVQVDRALTGVEVAAQVEIKWSWIEKNLETGILVRETGSPTLIGNEFTYNRVGLFLAGSGVVQENRFQSNSYGLLGTAVAGLELTGNSFESNTYGIYLEAGGSGNIVEENLIASNDYGIYIDGGIPARVNYNDLYNNRMYDFYHLAESDADARYNWWGTTSATMIDAYIYDQHDNTGSVAYGFVDYSEFLPASALAPTIVNLSVNPPALRSGTLTGTITFSKEMAVQVKPQITYGLYEPYTNHPVTASQGQWLSQTEYRFTSSVGETMPEGVYRFRISGAEAVDGQTLKTNIAYTFLVDRTPPRVYTGADIFVFSPNGDGRQDTLDVELYFDEPAVLTYGVYQGQTAVWGPESEVDYLQQKRIYWDGRNNAGTVLPEGEYELRLTVEDQAGNRNSLPEVIPVVLDVTPPELQIDPVGGIQTGVVELTGQVADTSNPLTSVAYREQGGEDWVQAGQVEGSLTGVLYSWDPAGMLDGLYELKVESSDLAGNSAQVLLNLQVDVNAPQVALTLPAAGAHLAGEVQFSGRAADYYLSGWKLELETAGVWTELAAGQEGYEGVLAVLDIGTYPDGEYRVRLTATDLALRTGLIERSFQVDNATPPELKASNIGPEYISPNGDGLADRLRFLLTFSEVVSWSIGITGSSGMTVCTLTGDGQTVEGYWDGKQTDGAYAEDGTYTYTLSYTDQVGHPGIVQTGQVVVDTSAPVLEINPLPAVTNTTLLTVAGEAAGFTQVLVNGEKVVVDAGAFVTQVTLAEGTNQLSVLAEDQALNRTVRSFTVQCDTVLPLIELDGVKTVTNRPEVAVSGRIVDAGLAKAGITIRNQLGETELELALTAGQTFALTLPLAVGTNELLFEAQDIAGNRGESSVLVAYLPTIPEIYLQEPVGPYLSAPAARVVLKVLEGSIPLDPASLQVALDGVPQMYRWEAAEKQVVLELTGLEEREYMLTAGAANTQGEAGGGLRVALVVDLTDPLLTLTVPLQGEVQDGWNGAAVVVGSVEDRNLQQLTVTLTPAAGGAGRLLATRELQGETAVSGVLAEWQVGEWANGEYLLEVVARDMAGRQTEVQRTVKVLNTGMVSGRVKGDLEKILEPEIYLVQGKEIRDQVAFDQLTGEFAGRVAVGRYDLVLMPWGYQAVILPGLQVKVGQTLAGLELSFTGEIRWNLASGKQLVAVPFKLTGAPAEAAGKLITFNGYDTDYYPLKDWTLLRPGRGYWVNHSEGLGVTLTGAPVTRQEYRLPLAAGWNLIGTPYNYPYPLEGLRFQLEGHTYTFAAARQAGKVDAGVWQFQSWYRQSSVLEPWSGYWIYVAGAGEVIFTPELAVAPFHWPVEMMQMLNAEPDVLQAPEWQVQIRASVGDAEDVENYFGTRSGTRTGFDQGADLREPPGFVPYVSVYFSETGNEQLTASYQPPVTGINGDRRWQMTVASGQTGWVELKWSLAPEAIYNLLLTDEETGTQLDMFREASYRFYLASGGTRRFTLTAHKGQFEIKRLYNYANPFAAKGPGKTGTRIRYLMTADASVEVTILDIVGRVVKRFPVMQAGKAGGQEGWNEFYWNGRNGKGEPVANGAYILKITASYGKKYYTKITKMAIINGR